VAHALEKDWLGTLPEPGPAMPIEAEDGEPMMHRRLAAIAKHCGTTFSELTKRGLRPVSLVNEEAVMAAPSRSGKIEPTLLYRRLFKDASELRPKFISIASSANVFAGNESDRSQVQQFIGLLTRLAIAANGYVLLIAHPSLTGINSESGLSGSTGWHNAVRARAYLKGVKPDGGEQPDSDLRELEFKKNNYGPVEESIILRYQNGLYLPVPGVTSLDKVASESRADDVFLALLRRFAKANRNVGDRPGPSYAPSIFAREGEAKAAALTSKHLEAAMRRLFKAEKIWNEPYGKPSRPHYRVSLKT
jgi:RecA-family ATPase